MAAAARAAAADTGFVTCQNGDALSVLDLVTGEERARWSVFDLAPTALHLMGHSIYEEMSGEAHPELLANPRPVQRIPRASDPTYRPSADAWKELTEEQRQAQIEQLKALGYADDSDD